MFDPELAKLKTDELIDLALAVEEPWEYDYIPILRSRGSEEVLLAAQRLCLSSEIAARKLGVDILGQLGIPRKTFLNQRLATLLKLLETETNEQVLYSIGIALGYLEDVRAVEPLVKFKDHPDAHVRYGVVWGISGHELPLAIKTLIELSNDNSDLVRDWATFGLGVLIDVDTPEIREALWQRLTRENTEDNYDIYGEALAGLAQRKDSRIIPFLIRELESDTVRENALEAVAEIGDKSLYSALIKLKERWGSSQYQYMSDVLDDAIASCRPEHD